MSVYQQCINRAGKRKRFIFRNQPVLLNQKAAFDNSLSVIF
jgi:hypothetical protein